MNKKLDLFKTWLIIYAFGIVLFPPIHFHEKTIYAAEWLLLPLFVALCQKALTKKLNPPPKILIWLFGAFIVAYIAGIFRGEKALDFSRYWNFHEDRFDPIQDAIQLIRYLIIFSLPWILSHFYVDFKELQYSAIFFKTMKYCLVASATLALFEKFGFWDLTQLYHPEKFAFFRMGRSYATFATPLEASLIFMAFIVQSLNHFNREKAVREILILSLLFLGVLMTKGGTALIGGGIAIIYILLQKNKPSKRPLILIGVIVLAVLLFILLPAHFLAVKSGNFEFRTRTWIKWAKSLPEYPHFLIVGMGFTKLIVDNSFLNMIIIGGLSLFVPFLLWMKKLLSEIPKNYYPFFIVWVISWLALDSLTYWGIGRVAWVLLSLLVIENEKTKRHHNHI